jgi:hypothetical protein
MTDQVSHPYRTTGESTTFDVWRSLLSKSPSAFVSPDRTPVFGKTGEQHKHAAWPTFFGDAYINCLTLRRGRKEGVRNNDRTYIQNE